MYLNLEAESVRRKVKRGEMANVIGKSYTTLTLKMAGKYPFTYDEAVLIQETFFPECDLKFLFKDFPNQTTNWEEVRGMEIKTIEIIRDKGKSELRINGEKLERVLDYKLTSSGHNSTELDLKIHLPFGTTEFESLASS